MNWLIVTASLVGFFWSGNSASQPIQEGRIALVIGNASYKSSPLANPVNDARLMERALKDSGFQVVKAENVTLREMRRLIRDFGERLKSAGGVGLFYFAGHGVQVRGDNFLVSIDSDIRSEDEVPEDSVNAQLVLEKMQAAGNRVNLVILDACRNNPFGTKSRSVQGGLAAMNAPSGALVAYATAPGAVAFDGNGSNGLYTRHLARVLRQPGLPVEEVFKQVRTAVRKESGNQQTPWENTALEGQFVFNAAEPAVAKPQPIQPVAPQPETPVRKSVESLLWESVKDSTNAAEVMTYTERYPNGSFSAAASARLALLQSVRPAPAVTAAFQIDRGVGHLTVKDALESKAQEMEVRIVSRTSDQVSYSSGDVIATDGRVLAVRIGPYVGTLNRGALWKFPLAVGDSGSASVAISGQTQDVDLKWRVRESDADSVDLDVSLTLQRSSSLNMPIRMPGNWGAHYAKNNPLPMNTKLSLRGGQTSPVLVTTTWRRAP